MATDKSKDDKKKRENADADLFSSFTIDDTKRVETGSTSATGSNTHSTNGRNLIEVREAREMGMGVFATTDITMGTLIAKEPPLFILLVDDVESRRTVIRFCEIFETLPAETVASLKQLHCNPNVDQDEYRAVVSKWYMTQILEKPDENVLGGRKLRDVVDETLKCFYIYITNRTELDGGTPRTAGVFLLHSRINHSCVPNSNTSYNSESRQLFIYATRDIKAGEQIFIDYITEPYLDSKQRAEQLQLWGFTCICDTCANPATDSMRRKGDGLCKRLKLYMSKGPASTGEALATAEELVEVLELQGLISELIVIYEACADLCLESGSTEKAIEYMRKSRRLHTCHFGTYEENRQKSTRALMIKLEKMEKRLDR